MRTLGTNHQKDKIAYVLLDLVATTYISDLVLELRVGWKTLGN